MNTKQKSLLTSVIIGGVFAISLPQPSWAQGAAVPRANEPAFGQKVSWDIVSEIEIKNYQGDTLGRVNDLVLDLTNGRIVEVLVVSDQFLRFGGKTVALPPEALIPDNKNKVYHLDMSAAAYKAAPAFNASKWAEATQVGQIAQAYRYFGQMPYFLVPGEDARRTTTLTGEPITSLGILQAMNKVINLNVDDMNNTRLGTLTSLSMDLPTGRILSVHLTVRNGQDPLITSNVISPTMLSYNAAHDSLLLDVTKGQYSQQPHIIFEPGAGLQTADSVEQPATSSPTMLLAQGTSYRDRSTTALLNNKIQAYDLAPNGQVEVGTQDGRVTLRGTVASQGAKDNIGNLAVNTVRLTNVDNQIVVTNTPGPDFNDRSMTALIYQIIERDEKNAQLSVGVHTINGRVVLSGMVNNQATKDRIEAIAKGVATEKKVDDEIAVTTQAQAAL